MADGSVVRRHGFDVLAGCWQGFSGWWLAGLHETVPPGWLDWAHGHTIPNLLLWCDRDLVICRIESTTNPLERRILRRHFSALVLDAWLAECNLKRDQVSVGPTIDRDLFFVRDLTLPKAALAALPKILEQEVLRRTPFQLSDIWHGATVAGDATADVLTMHHWIIRKDRADQALAKLDLQLGEVDFLAAGDANGEGVPVVRFHKAGHEDPAWARQAIRILAVAALGVFLLGLATFEWCQSSAATGVETSLDEAREAALGGGRGGFNQAASLFAMKADVGLLEVWDELSRVLPDHTFLTETRIANGKVTVSGFSSDAARLVRLIDQSPLFTGATLAAGITPDATEHKDRFSIVFKVRDGRLMRPSGDVAKVRGPQS